MAVFHHVVASFSTVQYNVLHSGTVMTERWIREGRHLYIGTFFGEDGLRDFQAVEGEPCIG